VVDETEIRRFIREDYPRLVNAVALVAGSMEAAEDLVQESLARAWYRTQRGEAIESLPSWVAAVSLNLARSRWRRLATERRALRHLGGERAAPPSEDRLEVERALASLPRRQREVAVLRYLIGMNTHETAEVLGVGEGTVKNSLAKARTALATTLRLQEMDDVPDR
jgi:RNA polymerase sigma-70 factor, ECF subfamily